MVGASHSKLGQLGVTNPIWRLNSNLCSDIVGQLMYHYNVANDITCQNRSFSDDAYHVNILINFLNIDHYLVKMKFLYKMLPSFDGICNIANDLV